MRATVVLPFLFVAVPGRDEESLVVVAGCQGQNEPVVEPRTGGIPVDGRPVESAAFARRNQRRLATKKETHSVSQMSDNGSQKV